MQNALFKKKKKTFYLNFNRIAFETKTFAFLKEKIKKYSAKKVL